TGEFALIGRLRERFGDIGDDAAVVEAPDGPLLLAADTVVAGVHTPPDLPLEDLGWQAVAVNVSDIAAMGGRPLHLLVTVAAPQGTDLDRLFDGVAEASKAYLCPVVGGDLTTADVLVVTVAVTGTVDGTPVSRAGARPGATLDQALTGGEDYELVFTAPVARLPLGFRIGTCTADPTQRTLAGQPLPAASGGWEHRF